MYSVGPILTMVPRNSWIGNQRRHNSLTKETLHTGGSNNAASGQLVKATWKEIRACVSSNLTISETTTLQTCEYIQSTMKHNRWDCGGRNNIGTMFLFAAQREMRRANEYTCTDTPVRQPDTTTVIQKKVYRFFCAC